jgi:hypothetical protein
MVSGTFAVRIAPFFNTRHYHQLLVFNAFLSIIADMVFLLLATKEGKSDYEINLVAFYPSRQHVEIEHLN